MFTLLDILVFGVCLYIWWSTETVVLVHMTAFSVGLDEDVGDKNDKKNVHNNCKWYVFSAAWGL